jgi:hypothetical protein
MNIRTSSNASLVAILHVLTLLGAGAALAAEPSSAAAPSPAQTEPSRPQREQMAKLHEQMAACLRSDKPMAQCREEMMKSCHEAMGRPGCAMMGMGMGPGRGMGSGMRRGGMR